MVTVQAVDEFKTWLREGDAKKPLAYRPADAFRIKRVPEVKQSDQFAKLR